MSIDLCKYSTNIHIFVHSLFICIRRVYITFIYIYMIFVNVNAAVFVNADKRIEIDIRSNLINMIMTCITLLGSRT